MTSADRLGGTEGLSRPVRLLETAALACILAVLVGRPFAAEMPFRTSQLVLTVAQSAEAKGEGGPQKPPDELVRVTFAMILLAALVLWSVALVMRRKVRLVGAGFGVMVLVFAAWAFASALRAVDVRGALTGALEQTTILAAALVMMHLAGDRRRRGVVIVALAALAGAMAVKAIGQVAWEIPQRIADFQADPEGQLAQVGIAPGSPRARMFEKRLRDGACSGYFGLANVFASLLVVLVMAAVGVAVEKFAAARRSRRSAPPKRGEIHLPTLAAVVWLVPVALAAVALILTRSTAGIAAGVLVAAVAALVMFRPGFFARHRRKFLAGCAAALLAGVCAVAVYGTARGSLPGRSMQVRWEYWVGSVGVIAESPALGVGPGGFGEAYLRHRLPAAAESTKSPHNFLLNAASQYGLVGGAIYLAMLVWMFLAATRPGPAPNDFPKAVPDEGNFQMVKWCVFLSAVVLIVRAVWVGSTNHELLIVEAAVPAVIFAVCLTAAMWIGSVLSGAGVCGRFVGTAVVCGLAGFALHNLVSFTLWVPATATVFWIAAGAMAGPAFALRPSAGKLRIPVAVLAVVSLVAAGTWLWRPVHRRSLCVRAAQSAYGRGAQWLAVDYMQRAAAVDPHDGFAPADLARLYGHRGLWAEAVEYAELAWRRSQTSSNAKILARMLWSRGGDYYSRALEMAEKAVELDPMNVRLRWEYAMMLYAAGRFDAAAAQIREVRRIDSARPADSDLRLTNEELKKLDLLTERIKHRRAACRSTMFIIT